MPLREMISSSDQTIRGRTPNLNMENIAHELMTMEEMSKKVTCHDDALNRMENEMKRALNRIENEMKEIKRDIIKSLNRPNLN